MPKKTYRTFELKRLTFQFTGKDNTLLEVAFRGGVQTDSTSKYSTSNEEIQNLLEGTSSFNRDFYIESVEDTGNDAAPAPKKIEKAPEPEVKPLTDVKDIRRFRNLVEMKNALEELGIEGLNEMNYMQCKAAAAKLGYDFQIQKK